MKKIFFIAITICLLFKPASFLKAENTASDPNEDWRKWEPKPPAEPPSIIYEKGKR